MKRALKPVLVLAVAVVAVLGLLPATAPRAQADPPPLPGIWVMTNYTLHPIWGRFELQSLDKSSLAEFSAERPLMPNERKSPPPGNGNIPLYEFRELYMWGDLCYLGSWWHLPRSPQLHVPWGHIRGDVPIEVGLVAKPGLLWLHLSEIGQPITRVDMNRTDAKPGDGCVMRE